jgi:putative sigma-54 modulation protein
MLPIRATTTAAAEPTGRNARRTAAEAFWKYVPRRRFMQVNITFRNLDPTEALKAHVRDRVERVQRFIDRPTEAHAVLHLENLHHHAELTVKAGRFLLRGTSKTGDMYASIDAAAEKIERQLKKHKEKLLNHKATPVGELPPVEVRHDVLDVNDISESPAKPTHRVVKSTEFQARPMTVDEAILQLDLLDSHFYVFQNAEDRSINVVFRRQDGNLGLIEARAG